MTTTYTLTASNGAGQVTAQATVTVNITVTVLPSAPPTLLPEQTQQFTAIVTGASDTSVTWSLQEGANGGAIDSNGLYTAPWVSGGYHVVATSVVDNSASGVAQINVTRPPAGTLDVTFGNGGVVTLPPLPDAGLSGKRVFVLDGGTTIVAGSYIGQSQNLSTVFEFDSTGNLLTPQWGIPGFANGTVEAISTSNGVLIGSPTAIEKRRFDGTLDQSFGQNDAGYLPGQFRTGLTAREDSKIVAAIAPQSGGFTYPAVMILNGDGSLFGQTPVPQQTPSASASFTLPIFAPSTTSNAPGAIIGYSQIGSGTRAITTFDHNGNPVTYPDAGNLPAMPLTSAIALNGEVLFPLACANGIQISRVNTAGLLDSSGSDGGSSCVLTAYSFGFPSHIAVDAAGRMVVTAPPALPAKSVFTVMRLNEDGSTDTSFAQSGVFQFDGGTLSSTASGVGFQGDGKIIVVGRLYDAANSTFSSQLLVARFWP